MRDRAATHAARAQFFCVGFAFATWGVHIPTVRARYGLDEAGLGIALLAAGVGSLAGLTQAGRAIGRWGPRAVIVAGAAGMCLGLALLLAMPGTAALFGLLVLFGAANGLIDVAVNAEASALEERRGRPLMSGIHGMFSIGGMAGALAGGVLLRWPQAHLAGVAAVLLLAMGLVARHLLPPVEHAGDEAAAHGFHLPRGALLLLGGLAGLGLIAEGAMYDWSVLYRHQELGSPQEQAALAYASFSAAMALTRFVGDPVRARVAPATLLRGSAALAAAAMAVLLLVSHPWVARAGFALVGVGFANVVPVLFAAASKVPGVPPAHGIAQVASLGYLGFMTGPPVIGFVAHATSLATGLWLVVLFAVVLAATARRALAPPRG
ncbi:MAG: Inner membrane protein YbjJ [Xylophilus sp.]|nr:MAG: Inner membrane protein YbjJ [Xylophilus sp.]